MTILSQVDANADIACALAPLDARDRVVALADLVGEGTTTSRSDGGLAIRIERRGRSRLEADVAAWAWAEKECCPFFGFALESAFDSERAQAPPISAQASTQPASALN